MKNLETTIGQDYANRWNDAANQILEGAKFNGTVYAKRGGTRNMDLAVYVNGEYIALGRFSREETEEMKALFLSLLEEPKVEDNNKEKESVVSPSAKNDSNKKAEWIVNDRVVHNNLNYNQMVDRYGMCNFE